MSNLQKSLDQLVARARAMGMPGSRKVSVGNNRQQLANSQMIQRNRTQVAGRNPSIMEAAMRCLPNSNVRVGDLNQSMYLGALYPQRGAVPAQGFFQPGMPPGGFLQQPYPTQWQPDPNVVAQAAAAGVGGERYPGMVAAVPETCDAVTFNGWDPRDPGSLVCMLQGEKVATGAVRQWIGFKSPAPVAAHSFEDLLVPVESMFQPCGLRYPSSIAANADLYVQLLVNGTNIFDGEEIPIQVLDEVSRYDTEGFASSPRTGIGCCTITLRHHNDTGAPVTFRGMVIGTAWVCP